MATVQLSQNRIDWDTSDSDNPISSHAPPFKHILFSTGNITRSPVRNLAALSSKDELMFSIGHTLSTFLSQPYTPPFVFNRIHSASTLEIVDPRYRFIINCEEVRKDLEVTLKLYLPTSLSLEYISEIINALNKHTGLTTVDRLIVSYSPLKSDHDSSHDLDLFQKFWHQLSFHFPDTILGIATPLPHNLTFTPSPTLLQIPSTLSPSDPLITQALENGMDVVVHWDHEDIENIVSEAVGSTLNVPIGSLEWGIKVTGIAKGRGVVLYKGYIVQASVLNC